MKTTRVFLAMAIVAAFATVQAFAAERNMPQSNFGTDRVSQLMHKTVEDSRGKKIGSISDVILDQNGHASYVILKSGGFLDLGSRLVPIPVSALHTGKANNLAVNADQAKIKNAPNFDSRHWPNFADSGFDRNVNGYYGVTQ